MSDHENMEVEIEALSDDDLESVSGGGLIKDIDTTGGTCNTTSGTCSTSGDGSCNTSGSGTCQN